MARPEDVILEDMVNRGIGVSGLTQRAIQQSNAPDLRGALTTSMQTLDNQRISRLNQARVGSFVKPNVPNYGGGIGVSQVKPTVFLTYGDESGSASGGIDKGVMRIKGSRGTGDVLSDTIDERIDLEGIRKYLASGAQVVLPGSNINLPEALRQQLQQIGVMNVDTGIAAKLRENQTRDVSGMKFLMNQVGTQVDYPDPAKAAAYKSRVQAASRGIGVKAKTVGIQI